MRTPSDWVAMSGTEYVEPGGGYHCVEIITMHWIIQANYIPPVLLWPSYSPSQCY